MQLFMFFECSCVVNSLLSLRCTCLLLLWAVIVDATGRPLIGRYVTFVDSYEYDYDQMAPTQYLLCLLAISCQHTL